MLFAESDGEVPGWLLLVFGGAGGGVVGSLLAFVWKVMDRRKADAAEREAKEDKDEETALGRLQRVMELREADCTKRIDELTRRIEHTDRRIDSLTGERDKLREKLAMFYARLKYQESLLRKSGVEVDDWEKPDTGWNDLPAVNLPKTEGEK